MTKQVYRIEKGNRGIYAFEDMPFSKFNSYINSMAWEHTYDKLRPEGREDGLGFARGYKDEGWRFAFQSLELLRQWFDGHLENLLKFKGVKVWEIEADMVVEGNSGLQCVFKKEIKRREINVFTGEYTRVIEKVSKESRGQRLLAVSKKVIASISRSYRRRDISSDKISGF